MRGEEREIQSRVDAQRRSNPTMPVAGTIPGMSPSANREYAISTTTRVTDMQERP